MYSFLTHNDRSCDVQFYGFYWYLGSSTVVCRTIVMYVATESSTMLAYSSIYAVDSINITIGQYCAGFCNNPAQCWPIVILNFMLSTA